MRILIAPIPPARDGPGAIGRVLYAQLVGLAERHEVTVAAVAGPEEFDLRAVDRLAGSGFDIHAARRLPVHRHRRLRRREADVPHARRPASIALAAARFSSII